MKSNYLVLVLFEDEEARRLANDYCDALARRFGGEFHFQQAWFSLADLSSPSRRKAGSLHACDADFIVFALAGGAIPQGLAAWAESAVARRCEKEGFVALISPTPHTRSELLLRNLAHRAGMDFLTDLPPMLGDSLPETPEPYTERAHEVSGLLAEILRRPSPQMPRLSV